MASQRSEMMSDEANRIVGVALLTRDDVIRLGSTLKKVFSVENGADFQELLLALDDLERPTAGRR